METFNLIKILTLFFTVVLIVNYGMHAIIVQNSHDVRDSAYDFVNEYCIEEYKQPLTYNDNDKEWKQINLNLTQ